MTGLIVIEGVYITKPAELVRTVSLGMLVVWAAHVFAATVAHAGGTGASREPLRAALGHALLASLGLLIASVVPLVLLWLGVAGVVDAIPAVIGTQVWAAFALAALGYVSLARAGLSPPRRLWGAVITALVGLALVALKVVVH
ncbi:hypothetical protein [Leifsonia sp. 22587]|uniref:hypothetical protein n=1 Tax=Leifsonia sp. 22587 TaxID=3453946 RepID=UPI003F867BC0